jgi:hypothetical protein
MIIPLADIGVDALNLDLYATLAHTYILRVKDKFT